MCIRDSFKLVPSYVASTPEFIPWVNLGRAVVLIVLVVGFIQSYKSIKSKYTKEIENNKATNL